MRRRNEWMRLCGRQPVRWLGDYIGCQSGGCELPEAVLRALETNFMAASGVREARRGFFVISFESRFFISAVAKFAGNPCSR